MENKNKETIQTKDKSQNVYKTQVMDYLKSNPKQSKILRIMDLQKLIKKTPENESEWHKIGFKVVFCLPNGTINSIYVERGRNIKREVAFFEKLWWKKILKNPQLLDEIPGLYKCPKCGEELCYKNFDGTYRCGYCGCKEDKEPMRLPKTEEEEKAYEQARINVLNTLEEFPTHSITIALPNGLLASIPIKKGQNEREEIQKMENRWWDYYEKKNPELIKNRKLIQCPKCGGELKIKTNGRERVFCACSNYPHCRYAKALK